MKKSETKNKEYLQIARTYNSWIHSESFQKKENTIISYKKTMKIFLIDFLQNYKHITKSRFSISVAFSKSMISEWAVWLIKERKNTLQSRDVRMSNLLKFLKYLSIVDTSCEIYYLEACNINLKRGVSPKVHALTEDAMEALVNAPNMNTKIGVRDHALMGLMYATAGRLNEVLSITIKDLKLKVISGGKSEVLLHGKGDKQRVIPIQQGAVDMLRKYIKLFHGDNPNDNDYLFFTKIKGERCKMSQRNVSLRLNKYAEIARIKCNEVPLSVHSHLFRHTRATQLLRDKHALPVVSSILGHQHVETTMRYIDITEDMIAEVTREIRSEQANNIVPIWDEDTDLSSYFEF